MTETEKIDLAFRILNELREHPAPDGHWDFPSTEKQEARKAAMEYLKSLLVSP